MAPPVSSAMLLMKVRLTLGRTSTCMKSLFYQLSVITAWKLQFHNAAETEVMQQLNKRDIEGSTTICGW